MIDSIDGHYDLTSLLKWFWFTITIMAIVKSLIQWQEGEKYIILIGTRPPLHSTPFVPPRHVSNICRSSRGVDPSRTKLPESYPLWLSRREGLERSVVHFVERMVVIFLSGCIAVRDSMRDSSLIGILLVIWWSGHPRWYDIAPGQCPGKGALL